MMTLEDIRERDAILCTEIERLRAESEAFRGKLAEQCGQTLVARAEIERWKYHEGLAIERCKELEAEIERLKTALGPGATEAWEYMYDEIERLTADVASLMAERRMWMDDIKRMRAALEPKP